VIVVYFGIAYFLPTTSHLLYPGQLNSNYFQPPLTLIAGLQLAGVFGLFLLLESRAKPTDGFAPSALTRLASWLIAVYDRWRLPFALASLMAAVSYFLNGLNGYRYAELGISETGSSLLLLVNLSNAVLGVDIFRMLFIKSVDDQREAWSQRVGNVVVAVAFLISAGGAFPVFIGLLALLHAVAPRMLKRLLFIPLERRGISEIRHIISRGLLILVLYWAAWLTGEGIKSVSNRSETVLGGAAVAAENVTGSEQWVRDYYFYLLERTSIYYYSFLYTVDHQAGVEAVADGPPILAPLRTLAFRLDFLTGGFWGVEKPEIPSIMRLNYLLTAVDPSRLPRAGTAPGVIGAFNYMVPLPLATLLCALYLSLVSRILSALIGHGKPVKASAIGLLTLYMFAEPFLQSPFDLLALIDGATVSVLGVCLLYLQERTAPAPRVVPRVTAGSGLRQLAWSRQQN